MNLQKPLRTVGGNKKAAGARKNPNVMLQLLRSKCYQVVTIILLFKVFVK